MSYNETSTEKENALFKKKTPTEKSGLEKAIDSVLSDLESYDSDSPEYARSADQLVKLHALKANESPNRVSADTAAIVAGNLAGILIIVGYERTHVAASKALSFLSKLR